MYNGYYETNKTTGTFEINGTHEMERNKIFFAFKAALDH